MYELLGDRPRAAAQPLPSRYPAHDEHTHERDVDEAHAPHEEERVLGIAPGQVLRLPVGYVIIAGVVAIGLFVGMYAWGFSRGEARAEQRFANGGATVGANTGEGESINDPLNQAGAGSRGSTRLGGETNTATPGGNTGAGQQDRTNAGGTGVRTSEVESGLWFINAPRDDPRVPGLNYYNVTYLSKAQAEEAARFLVRNGVPAARTTPNSRGLCYVVAMQGFEAGTLDEPEARAYVRMIKALGRQYKAEEDGPTDFSDMWPQKFTPGD